MKKYVLEKIYLYFYIVPLLIIAIATIINLEYYGEAKYITLGLNRVEIILLFIMSLLCYFFVYILYKKTKYKIPHFKGFPKITFNKRRTNIIVFFILIIQIAYTLFTGNGRVSSMEVQVINSNILSSVINLLNIQSFFNIYFIFCREERKLSNNIFWINTLLYSIYQLIQGWTSFIFELGFIQMFLFLKNRRRNYTKIITSFPVALSTIFFIFGSLIYKIFYPLKNFIRSNQLYDLAAFNISYFDAMQKLIERFCNFPITLLSIQNANKIISLYRVQTTPLIEVVSFFRPLLPGFIFPFKNFRSLNNLVLNSAYINLVSNTGTGFSIVCYVYLLFRADFIAGICWLILFFLLSLLTTSIFYAINNENNDASILYFMFLIAIIQNGSLEINFSYGIIGGIYLYIILYFMGAFKFVKMKL